VLNYARKFRKGCVLVESSLQGISSNSFLLKRIKLLVKVVTQLTRVMRAAVPIPAVASASVLQSAAVGGSVVDVVRPL